MPEPVEHVRRPHPPWRKEDARTECGRPVSDVRLVITRDEFTAKLQQQGKRRAALSTCMTCLDTASQWPTWEQDPVQAIHRETYSNYGGRQVYGGAPVDEFRDELVALAELVNRHPEEFEAIRSGLSDTVSLADRRKRGLGHG